MPRTKTNRHGQHQEIHLGEWKRDRIGILSGSVRREIAEDFDFINFSLLATTAAPAYGGVPCVNVVRSYNEENGFASYTYSYEGVNQDYQFADTEITYELDISMSEDPIQSHANFPALKVKYAWSESKKAFAATLPAASASGGTGLGGSAGGKTKANPLYGDDSYLAVGAHYRVSYARRAVPGDAVQRTNTIIQSPPGIGYFALPAWAAKRNWLGLGPKVTHRGNVVQIAEEFLLSGPKGWNPDVYGAGKIDGSGGSGDSSTALTIGSIQGSPGT